MAATKKNFHGPSDESPFLPVNVSEAKHARDKADNGWLDQAGVDLSSRLGEMELEDDPAELTAWKASFRAKSVPCKYVPGKGFVPL